ncbi:DUF4097 family beta strand repeat-containing protein, partial [Salinispira pacifica]
RSSCGGSAERSGELSSSGVELVSVVAGAGTLQVHGDGNRISVSGKVCAPNQVTADNVRIRMSTKAGTAAVVAEFPYSVDGADTRLDLTVRIPPGLEVSVINRSGDVSIEGVAGVTFADLAGNVRIRKISGGVTITRNAKGHVLIEDIAGTAAVQRDLGGTLELRRIDGNVVIQHSETERIVIQDIRGDVVLWNDGPGDVQIENVRGDLFIQSDHGGKLVYRRILGSVHLPESQGL